MSVDILGTTELRPMPKHGSRKRRRSLGRTAQDGHLDSHTAPELCIRHGGDGEVLFNVLRLSADSIREKLETGAEAWFNIALRPRKPEGSLGRTAQDGHLDSHTAPELFSMTSFPDSAGFSVWAVSPTSASRSAC